VSAGGRILVSPSLTERAKEVVSLVVYDNKGGEIFHLDPPDRFHPEFGIFDDLNLADTVLGQPRGRPANRAEIKAAMFLAGRPDLGSPVALRERDEAAARRHKSIDIAVHAAGCGRAERAGGVSRRRLRRSGIVDRVVLYIIGQPFAVIEPLFELCVRDVARHDQRTGQAEAGLDRVSRQDLADLVHRSGQVDRHDLAAERRFIDFRKEAGGVRFELFEKHALDRDLAENLTVGRAGDADPDRQAGTMPRQPDHSYVMAEILAAELRADAKTAGKLEHVLFEPTIAVGLAILVALAWQRVEVAAAGELNRFQIHLGRSAADHDGQVVGRASGRPDGADFLVEELQQRLRVEYRPCLLIQKALVGRATAFGDEQKFVFFAGLGEQVDLRRQVVTGIDLLVHRQRGNLAVA